MQECEAGSHPLRVLLMFSFLCIWLRSQVSDETAVPVYAARSVSFLPLLHQSMCPWGSTPVSFFHRGLQNLSSLFHTLRASWCAVHWVYPFPPPTNPPTHGTDASKLPTLQSVVKKGGDKYFRQDAFLHVGVSVLHSPAQYFHFNLSPRPSIYSRLNDLPRNSAGYLCLCELSRTVKRAGPGKIQKNIKI